MTHTMETKNEKYFSVNDLTPAYHVHPGGLIAEEIRERGFRQKDFAQRIGMQASQLSAIIHGVRSITPAVAAKLEMGFGNIPAKFWLGMQEKYNVDLHKTRLAPSSLVTGYTPGPDVSVVALADPGTEYGKRLRVTVTLPAKDRELLEMLASRMSWDVSR